MLHTATFWAVLLLATLLANPARPCSRFLWNDNKLGVFVARTMDWPESTEPVITVFPRGMARDGGKVGLDVVVKENPAKWTSKYGSMVTTVYGFQKPGHGSEVQLSRVPLVVKQDVGSHPGRQLRGCRLRGPALACGLGDLVEQAGRLWRGDLGCWLRSESGTRGLLR